MATFFGIYSKSGNLKPNDFVKPLHNFALDQTRELVKKEFKGLILCFVKRFEKCYGESDRSISFISGHISFENLLEENSSQAIADRFISVSQNDNPNSFAQLEGAFAAINYDKQKHVLTLVNDKFGVFPLFIYENADHVFFSSEYQPLLHCLTPNDCRFNTEAISEFLSLGVTLSNKTFFEKIYDLAPASYIRVNEKKTTEEIYWKPRVKANWDGTAIELFALLTKINKEYLDGGHTELCLLSAGADSRFILATMSENQRATSEFYTSNLSFLDASEDKDVIGAMMLSQRFSLKHTVEKVSFYENQFGSGYFHNERRLRDKMVYGGWHGGEFLGGLFESAAPATVDLEYKDVDNAFKSVFHWLFRFKLRRHPYKSYQIEKEKQRGHLFLINQLTNSFFSSIYGGTKSHWVQPYQLTTHGLSPFWDSRFLQKLLDVPIEQLKNYALYNQVLKHCRKEFTDIPSNSPLTKRHDSVMPRMEIGIEPKNKIPDTHLHAFIENEKRGFTSKKWFYNARKMKKKVSDRSDVLSTRWLDFEVWLNYIAIERGGGNK